MAQTNNSDSVFLLKEDVRIFSSGPAEFRFRKGVWSFTEAVIRLEGQEERVKRFFTRVVDELTAHGEADLNRLASDLGISSEELPGYRAILDRIRDQGFLHRLEESETQRIVSFLLGGNISGFEEYIGPARPVLFVSDQAYAREAARSIASTMAFPVDFLDEQTLSALAQADLTTKTEAMEHLKAIEAHQQRLAPYACVVVCLSAPHVSLLRNLNRVLIRLEKPLVAGLLDGPFLHLLSTSAAETGCFECFEHRLLARLEDTVVYQRFVEAGRLSPCGLRELRSTVSTPILHMLVSGALAEAFLFATLGMLRLAGRVVSIYLPVLEIQVEDLLRVPYCPACGFVSAARMDEMFTSSRRIVNEMVSKIEIRK